MENTVIQHTFLKFDQSQKNRFFKKPQNPRQNRKTPDLVKKTAVATLDTSERNQTANSRRHGIQGLSLNHNHSRGSGVELAGSSEISNLFVILLLRVKE